jgi:hypothetical protein
MNLKKLLLVPVMVSTFILATNIHADETNTAMKMGNQAVANQAQQMPMPNGMQGMPSMNNAKNGTSMMNMGKANAQHGMNGDMMKMMQQKQAMMQKKQAMMQAHMQKMETHTANIEALLKELVILQKSK